MSFFSLFPFPFRPTPSCGFSIACRFQLVPRPPGRGMCERTIDLRLRVWSRAACFPSYRVALVVRVFISRLALLPRFSVGSCSPASGPVSCFTSRASPCLFHPSRSHAALVRSCLVPPIAPPCLSGGGAMNTAGACVARGRSVACFGVSASGHVRSRSPVVLVSLLACRAGPWRFLRSAAAVRQA